MHWQKVRISKQKDLFSILLESHSKYSKKSKIKLPREIKIILEIFLGDDQCVYTTRLHPMCPRPIPGKVPHHSFIMFLYFLFSHLQYVTKITFSLLYWQSLMSERHFHAALHQALFLCTALFGRGAKLHLFPDFCQCQKYGCHFSKMCN